MVSVARSPRRAGGLVPLDAETTALIYSRVSSDDQAIEGVSLPAQVAESRRYVGRQGWIFGDEFQDIETGRRDDRRAYQELLSTVRSLALDGKAAAVVVASLDRLGRNLSERVRAYEELKRLSVPIHSAREGGIVSEFTYNILAAVAQEESRKLGERVRASQRHFVEGGWHPVGIPAWGYRWRPATVEQRADGSPTKVLEPHPDEAPYVREAWERLGQGESIWSISRWAAGLPGAARGGRNLDFSVIRRILRSPVYVARFRTAADGKLDKQVGRWEPLVSDETWRTAQDSLAMGRKMPRQASGEFPLTGLIRCAKCGGRMCGRTSRFGGRRPERREYWCTSSMRGATRGSGVCTWVIPAAYIEHAVLRTVGEILEAVDGPEARPAARRAWAARERRTRVGDDIKRIAALEQQAQTARRRISAASVKFLDGEIDREAYDIVRADLAAELESVDSELGRLRDRPQPVALGSIDDLLAGVGGWARALRLAAPAEVRKPLGVLIETVTPIRVGYAQYEARIEWTPRGSMLLCTAVDAAPSENLQSVEALALTKVAPLMPLRRIRAAQKL